MLRINDCGPDPAERLIIEGRIARVRRSVPNIFVWMIFSISDSGVSANGTGISWDAPTLFTAHQHYQTGGMGGDIPRIPISRVFASSSNLANPVCLSSGLETSIATTLVSTLYLAADYESSFDVCERSKDVQISSATS